MTHISNTAEDRRPEGRWLRTSGRRRAFGGVVLLVGLGLCVLGEVTRATESQALLGPLDVSSPVPYFVADGRGKTGFRATDVELGRWAFDAWQRTSTDAIRFTPSPEREAVVRLYWAEPTEGQYGEMQSISVGGRLGAAVYIRPDMDSLGPEIAQRASRDTLLRDSIVYLTCVHELGHALGLSHTRDYRDIMYFFGYGGDIVNYFGRYRAELGTRSDIAKMAGLSAVDATRLKTLYGIN